MKYEGTVQWNSQGIGELDEKGETEKRVLRRKDLNNATVKETERWDMKQTRRNTEGKEEQLKMETERRESKHQENM